MCVLPAAHQDLALETADAYGTYRDELVAAGLLVPMGVPGVYGRGEAFERVIARFDGLVSRKGEVLSPEIVRFPPVFARANYERIDHIHNFPDLMGSVHTFAKGEREHRAMVICGIAGYRNDSKLSLGRHVRDAIGAGLMVNNDRILGQNATMHLGLREA